jgi:uncharacterized metal-binding protein YceD (DUF177 family)
MKVNIRDIEDGRFSQTETLNKVDAVFSDATLTAKTDFSLNLSGDKFEQSFLMTISFFGEIEALCDRCMEDITINVSDSCKLLMSYDPDLAEYDHDDFDDVIQLKEDDIEIDITKIIVESIELALPMKRVHKSTEKCEQFEASENSNQSLANNTELEKLKKMFNS